MIPSTLLIPSPPLPSTSPMVKLLFDNNNKLISFGSNSYLDDLMYKISRNRLRRFSERERSVEDVVNTTFTFYGLGNYLSIQSVQIKSEIIGLAKLIAERDPKTIVEIGTFQGGTLYIWSRINSGTPKTIISIDLPGGAYGGGYSQRKERLFREFNAENTLHLVRADSHRPSTRDGLRELLHGSKVDYLFLDGDHTYDGVRTDFDLYKGFIGDGGIVALHDILPNRSKPECGVHLLWEEIRDDYESKVFIESYEQGWAGIGVLQF